MQAIKTYSSFGLYKKKPETKKENQLPYDKPEEFGKALAEQHLKLVRTMLKDWVEEEKNKNQTKFDES